MFARLHKRPIHLCLAAVLLVLLWPVGNVLAADPSPSPTASPRPIYGPRATLVEYSNQEPWIAQVSGFDASKVQSVTYFVRDAAKRWHPVGPITEAPFAAELEWWTWDVSGQVVVTSHVQTRSGHVDDPGGWTKLDGRSVNPGGHLETITNVDDSLGARYTPARPTSMISAVRFWLRVSGSWSQVAEVSEPSAAGTYEVASIAGTSGGGWKSDDTAMSVHVVWEGGRQWVDPAPWAWRNSFVPPPTPAPTPTPVATPTPTPTAAAPAPAAPAAPAPATPPPAPAPAACYPKTNSGGCYQPGQFCRTADRGTSGRTASGEAIVCRDNNGWRWEPA